MELIILLIRLIAKAFDSGPKSPAPSGEAARQMDLARQIQQRIEDARLRAAREQRAQDTSEPMMARLPPPAQRPVNRPAAQRQQTGQQPTAKRTGGARSSAKRKSKRVAPPPLPSRSAPPLPATAPTVAAQSPDAAPLRRPAMASADAKLLSRWLRPQTLRAQFILTEVFQPPLSLRESHLF